MKRAAAPAAMSAISSVRALRGRGAASGVLRPICQQSRKLGPVRGGRGVSMHAVQGESGNEDCHQQQHNPPTFRFAMRHGPSQVG